MARCDVCGNDYRRSFTVSMNGNSYTFDSFECAIHRLAPACAHCQCRIVGHGIEAGELIYCCAHCARNDGVHGAVDHPAQQQGVSHAAR
ncbi:MAG: hypothetical protein AB7L76_18795 [Burkholderiaceae bacterium]